MYETIRKHFENMGISKVVVYGYKQRRHTHHWIQAAFYRAFLHLQKAGIPFTLSWDDNRSLLRPADLEGALVIGNINVKGVDFALPLSDKAYYVMHNHAPKRFDAERYRVLKDIDRCMTFEVFRGRTFDDTYTPVEGEPLHAVSRAHKNAILTWATDLLPDEIEQNKAAVREKSERDNAEKKVVFVGSIWRVNKKAIEELIDYCVQNKLPFVQYGGYIASDFNAEAAPGVSFQKEYIDMEAGARIVREAYLAPAIQGESQLAQKAEVGNYVPCRVFKNISYGNLAITNNATAQELFSGQLIYDPNISTLMKKAEERAQARDATETLLGLMDEVKQKHTYINRIETLLFALDACREPAGQKTALPHGTRARLFLSNVARRVAALTVKLLPSGNDSSV